MGQVKLDCACQAKESPIDLAVNQPVPPPGVIDRSWKHLPVQHNRYEPPTKLTHPKHPSAPAAAHTCDISSSTSPLPCEGRAPTAADPSGRSAELLDQDCFHASASCSHAQEPPAGQQTLQATGQHVSTTQLPTAHLHIGNRHQNLSETAHQNTTFDCNSSSTSSSKTSSLILPSASGLWVQNMFSRPDTLTLPLQLHQAAQPPLPPPTTRRPFWPALTQPHPPPQSPQSLPSHIISADEYQESCTQTRLGHTLADHVHSSCSDPLLQTSTISSSCNGQCPLQPQDPLHSMLSASVDQTEFVAGLLLEQLWPLQRRLLPDCQMQQEVDPDHQHHHQQQHTKTDLQDTTQRALLETVSRQRDVTGRLAEKVAELQLSLMEQKTSAEVS